MTMTTSVEDQEGSRKVREWEFSWLGLTAEEWQKGKEKTGVLGRSHRKQGRCTPSLWLGACRPLSHSESDRSRRHGRFGNADTHTSAVYPPVLVNICVPTQ